MTKSIGHSSIASSVKSSRQSDPRLKNFWQFVLLAVLFALLAGSSLHAQTVVYQTGFDTPGFALGNLAGQNGWTSGVSGSQNAAKIIAVSGGQELEISGSLVGLNSPNFYNCSFNKSLTNYNPVASGTPIVDVSADIWQQQGANTSQSSWQFAFLILNDQNGNAYGTIGIDPNGVVFAQNWGSPNQVVGDGSTATNNLHHLMLELNFTNRTMTLFKDGFSCGTMTFNATSSNKLGSVSLVVQGGNPITSTLFVDNLSITAGTVATPSACQLQITSAGPCLGDGTSGTPSVGNIYGLKVIFNVKGPPQQPFRIKWTIANVTYYYNNISVGPGSGYWWGFNWWLDLDDPIPWSVTLDPDGVSGNTNLVSSTTNGWFTPIPPTNAVELYAPRMMHGSEYYTLNFQPGSGNLNNLWVVFGVPTTHGAQQAVSMTSPTNGQTIITAPNSVPVFVISRTNVPAQVFHDTNYFTVQLNNIRVNPSLLRTNTWAGLASMTTNWTQWLAPDQMDQSTNSVIAAFVRQSLPTNYQSVLTPYDTARTLHRAVMRALTYQSPSLHIDALGVTQDGVADCGGFAHLLTACLRNVGIPARMISGFWQGDTQWHCRTEFHLPNVQWLLADPTEGQGADPTGTYAYYFGDVPDANEYLAVDTGDAHILPCNNFTFLQVPNWWWSGGGTYNSYAAITYLQPNGVLNPTNGANGSTSFYLSDAPTEGSVVIQTSTNLINWSPVATNAATGSVLNYSFPNNNGLRKFYRAQVSP